MTTDEIIDRLKQVSFTYSRLTADTFSSKEIARDKQALTAAVQAVEVLEEIRSMTKRVCMFCAHRETSRRKEPCYSRMQYGAPNWEWRWPLGEEADHGTR